VLIQNNQALVFVICNNVKDAAEASTRFQDKKMFPHGELVFYLSQLNKHSRTSADKLTVCVCNNWSSILLTYPQQSHWHVLVFSRQQALVTYVPSELGLKNSMGFSSVFPVRPIPVKRMVNLLDSSIQ
jgi:hypothetical protein